MREISAGAERPRTSPLCRQGIIAHGIRQPSSDNRPWNLKNLRMITEHNVINEITSGVKQSIK